MVISPNLVPPWDFIRTSTEPFALTPIPCRSIWTELSELTDVAHMWFPVESTLAKKGL